MSNAKLAAAKELIQEKQYDAARKILETMNDATARRWLEQLNSIAPQIILPPPPPMQPPYYPSQMPGQAYTMSPEQEQFYRAENRSRHRRRIGNGIELIFMGIGCVIVFVFFAIPTPSIEQGGKLVINLGWAWCLAPMGITAILAGLYRIATRN